MGKPLNDSTGRDALGNSTFRPANAALLSVSHVEAPVVVPSSHFDEVLAPTLERLRLRPGLLEKVAGVTERRWWADGQDAAEVAAECGVKALSEAGVDASEVGLVISTTVTRPHLEPAIATAVHHGMDLPASAMNFDITNACLGWVNGLQVASAMIDAGAVRYAVVLGAEDVRSMHEGTIARLQRDGITRKDFLNEFATMTLGCGAAAAVLGRADEHPEAHRVLGGVTRAGTAHHELCIGDMNHMRTDTKLLLNEGIEIVADAFNGGDELWGWRGADRFVIHQISRVHTQTLVERVGIDPAKVPMTFPRWGNVGPISLPMTLAATAPELSRGDRVVAMGVGSGLNTAMIELAW
ncbi:3-oxoacyl-ACP synthase III [Paenibacillus sp. TRM 82003]|uniref:3-oxoacyl-ACP synthase III n=1 Tax=Kineococcus sp. TRM81007 TaxID=2925831 RepID=UPI001F592350|nr:3-oxoacyl-ACP synthase III [Kineococcus sp. TRM81007]MCI2240585.1 3-oxoacyl-ACP synthase III [Kineococcus sp. TRM81007]MCI3925493.1 3-oxoacyl-ACP synthase III [Paenibacillus sp. TRM 82003]